MRNRSIEIRNTDGQYVIASNPMMGLDQVLGNDVIEWAVRLV